MLDIQIALVFGRQVPEPSDFTAQAQIWAWWRDDSAPWSGTIAGPELWKCHRDAVLRHWARYRPGRRPDGFWRFQAPEPRRRLGGVGEAWGTHQMCRGIPAVWNFGEHLNLWHNPPTPIDEGFPPLFESEAAYLRRLHLFLPGEEKRVKPANFSPESVFAILSIEMP